jgi:hypothetical protein
MAFAQLPALVEAAVRADRERGEEEEEGEEEEVYVLLDFSSAELPPGVELRGDLAIDVRRTTSRCFARAPPRARPTRSLVFFCTQALDTAAPTIQLGEHVLRGTYEEDIGSTLIFDRSKLKRAAEAHDRALRDLVFEEVEDEQRPLVCVTTKRLRLRPAIESPDEAADARRLAAEESAT